jgi:hypothetical protein
MKAQVFIITGDKDVAKGAHSLEIYKKHCKLNKA